MRRCTPARWFLTLVPALLLVACDTGKSPSAEQAVPAPETALPMVVATNFPLYDFARRIAGDSVEVVFPRIEGDPAFWRPGPEDIELLQSADAVLLNGAGYESWLDWVSLRESRLLDTSAGFTDQLIPLVDETVHQHGPSGEHSHAGYAFTTWLDPDLAALQATVVAEELSRLAPESSDQHQARLAALLSELERLDAAFRGAFDVIGQQALLFSHPVYQYLERKYALNGHSLHWEPDAMPTTGEWLELRKILAHHTASLMIWEDEPTAEIVESLVELGIRPMVLDPAGNAGEDADFLELMAINAERIAGLAGTD